MVPQGLEWGPVGTKCCVAMRKGDVVCCYCPLHYPYMGGIRYSQGNRIKIQPMRCVCHVSWIVKPIFTVPGITVQTLMNNEKYAP
jgi:hypothetical protein